MLFICKRERIHGDDLLDIDGVSNGATEQHPADLNEKKYTFVYDTVLDKALAQNIIDAKGINVPVDNVNEIEEKGGNNYISVTADGWNSEGKYDDKVKPRYGTEEKPLKESFDFDAKLIFYITVIK